MDTPRLSKTIALTLGISRREADELIAQGRIKIDGTVATLGARAATDALITLDDRAVQSPPALRYIALNKPVGYVCSRKQQGEAPTIYSLLPEEYQHLKPVGRLDKDSSGLILLTNDGDFTYQMTHPKFHKTKTYEVTLDHDLAPLHRQMISDHGIALEDGLSQLQLERLSEGDDIKWRVLMHEGRNRQIRRTFAALGYTVTALHRTVFGAYRLDNLESGHVTSIKKQ